MSRYFLFFLCSIFITASATHAQTASQEVNKRLRMIAMGRNDEVIAGLAQLEDEYPDDEGVLFLKAALTDNALRACRIYEGIVKNTPQSEWADDAQFRIVQFYALRRDTARTITELENYRKNYPNSEFLLAATDAVKATVGLPRPNVRTLSSANATTTGNTITRTPPPAKETVKEVAKETPKVDIVAVAPAVVTPGNQSRWGLQVGSYSIMESAISEVNRFKNKRIRAAMEKKQVNGQIWYAVIIGDYSSRESAEKAQPVVETQCACQANIIEKSGEK